MINNLEQMGAAELPRGKKNMVGYPDTPLEGLAVILNELAMSPRRKGTLTLEGVPCQYSVFHSKPLEKYFVELRQSQKESESYRTLIITVGYDGKLSGFLKSEEEVVDGKEVSTPMLPGCVIASGNEEQKAAATEETSTIVEAIRREISRSGPGKSR